MFRYKGSYGIAVITLWELLLMNYSYAELSHWLMLRSDIFQTFYCSECVIIIIIIIIISSSSSSSSSSSVLCHIADLFSLALFLKPTAIPTAQASSFRLQYLAYYV